MNERWDDESVLRDWLGVLSRQRWIVVIALIIVPLIAVLVSRGQQKLYQASATVLVSQQNPTAAALNLNNGVATPPDRFVATQAALARVGTVVEQAVKSAKAPHRTAQGLLAHSSVSANPNTDLLQFSVTDPEPGVAKRLATSYAKQFTVYRRGLDSGALSVAIADVRRKLDAIVASGDADSPLYRSLAATYRDLQATRTLQAAGSSAVVVGGAGSVTQVQPKTTRNAVLALLVGLALGIGLAFLRESLDTRVRSVEELRERLGLPLLGQVPNPARRLERSQRPGTLSADGLRTRLGLPLLGEVLESDRPPEQADGMAALPETTGLQSEAFGILKANLDISPSCSCSTARS